MGKLKIARLLTATVLIICTQACFAAANPVAVEISPTNPYGFFWGKADAPAVSLAIKNTSDAPVDVETHVTVYNHRHEYLCEAWKDPITVAAGATVNKNIVLGINAFGVYDVEVNAGAVTKSTRIGWIAGKAEPWNDSPFGVCTHFSQGHYRQSVPWLTTTLRDMGASWIRDELYWGSIEKSKGQLALPDVYKQYLDVVKDANLQLLLVMDYGNQFYDNGNAPYTDEGRAAYLRYLQWTVTTLSDYCQAWEIWNEPDNNFWKPKPNPQQYAALAKAVYPAVKATPEGKRGTVVAGVPSWFNFSFIDATLAAGLGTSLDVYSLHPYGLPGAPDLANFTGLTETLRKKLDENGARGRDIWYTEFGYCTMPNQYTEDRAAAYMTRLYLLALAKPYVKRLFFYDLIDDGSNPKDGEHHMGLMRVDGAPKVGYVAYNTLAHSLAQKTFLREVVHTDNVYCEEFAGPNGKAAAAWATQGAGTLSFATPNPAVTVTDLMGNATRVAAVKGRVSIPLTYEPVFVSDYGTLTPAAPLLSIGDKIPVVTGRSVVVTLTVDANLNNAAWTMKVPDGWQATRIGQSLQWRCTPSNDSRYGNDFPVIVTSDKGMGTGACFSVSDPLTVTGAATTPNMVQFTVVNPFADTVTATYMVTCGDNEQGAKSVTVAGKSTATITLPVQAETAMGWEAMPVDVSVRLGTTWRKFTRIIGGMTPCYTIPPVTVDGDIASWKTLKPCVLNKPYQEVNISGKYWQGINDLSAHFWLADDKKNLCLAVAVEDQQHVQTNDVDELWKSDSVQFALSPDGSSRYEFTLAVTADGAVKVSQAETGNGRIPAEHITAAAKRNGTETDYEITIPWSDLKIVPGKTPARFSLLVNDDDGQGRKGWLEWFSGIGLSKDPTKYSPVQFMPVK
ncbi:MAG TPA: sugar-binding protein [Armatimonadota bacterium]|nr:sugar-binding protein [Armatimonadota bacterium]